MPHDVRKVMVKFFRKKDYMILNAVLPVLYFGIFFVFRMSIDYFPYSIAACMLSVARSYGSLSVLSILTKCHFCECFYLLLDRHSFIDSFLIFTHSFKVH